MKRLLLIATLALFSVTVVAQTETVQVDITKLTQQELLVYQQLKQKQASAGISLDNLTPDKVEKTAQLAKSIGVAINEGLGAITKNVDQFVQTRAGMWIAALITWRVAGQDAVGLVEKMVQYAVGIPLLFTGTLVFVWIIRRKCLSRPALVSTTKLGWFTVKREYKGVTSPDWGGEETIITALCYAAFIGLCCLIIFPG